MGLFSQWAPSDFQEQAAEFCHLARETYQLDLDYSAHSLQKLDEMINVYFGPGSADDNAHLIVAMGCYVGEVVMSAGGNRGLVSPTCHSLQKFVPV